MDLVWYEVDYKKPILYVVPIQSILGKLPLVPVGDTGTIQHSMRNAFSGAPGGRDAGDGCRMWFGIGMVPWPVINLTGLQLRLERYSHVLSSALAVL